MIDKFEITKNYGTNKYMVGIQIKNRAMEIFPLEWIIFGSKGSLDIDVAINLPIGLLDQTIEFYKLLCVQIDMLLGPILKETALSTDKEKFPNNYFEKPINSGCIHISQNKYLSWTQKGDLDESNNSIRMTFNNHPQMYEECPVLGLIERSLDTKYVRCLNMLINCLAESYLVPGKDPMEFYKSLLKGYFRLFSKYHHRVTELDRNKNISNIVNLLITAPILTKKLRDTFKGVDSLIEPIKTLDKLIGNKRRLNDYETIMGFRTYLVKTLKDQKISEEQKVSLIDQIVDKYCNIYPQIYKAHDRIVRWISENPYIFGSQNDNKIEARKQANIQIKQFSGTLLSISLIAKIVEKSKLVIFTENLLKDNNFNWKDIVLLPVEDRVDKYKKIAFQLAQTHALYFGKEFFTKEDLVKNYPELNIFLIRLPISNDNLSYLTDFMIKVLDLYDNSERKLLVLP